MRKNPSVILSILGPTGIGKTQLISEAFTEKEKTTTGNLPVVISCDSRQIYRGLQIGTAGPSEVLKKKSLTTWLIFYPHKRDTVLPNFKNMRILSSKLLCKKINYL